MSCPGLVKLGYTARGDAAVTVELMSARGMAEVAVADESGNGVLPRGGVDMSPDAERDGEAEEEAGPPAAGLPGARRSRTIRAVPTTASASRVPAMIAVRRLTLTSVIRADRGPRYAATGGRLSVGLHVGVAPVGGGNEGLLEGAGRYPAQQVERRASLVVGAALPGPPEGLLAHHRPGRFVIDVEVAGGVSEGAHPGLDRPPFGGEDRAGQPIRGGLVDQPEDRLPVAVVGVDGEDGAEQLPLQELVMGIPSGDDRGPDKPTGGGVARTAGHDLEVRVLRRRLQRRLVLAEGTFVDDRPHEVREVGGIAHGDRLGLAGERLPELPPEATGDAGAGGRRALLALVLEGAAEQAHQQSLRRGALVSEDKVLAPGLTDQPRVGAVGAEVAGDLAPEPPEGVGRAREVDPS